MLFGLGWNGLMSLSNNFEFKAVLDFLETQNYSTTLSNHSKPTQTTSNHILKSYPKNLNNITLNLIYLLKAVTFSNF